MIEGGVQETTELMNEPWGLVFFTGSERVGKVSILSMTFAATVFKVYIIVIFSELELVL